MNLDGIIRDAVALAKDLTAQAQADITLEAWTAHGTSGAAPTYAAGVTIPAMVDEETESFRTTLGEVIPVKAVIRILQPVAANGADDREEPIDPRDRITLPSGTVGAPIMGAGGLVDPSTGRPYWYTVLLK